MILYTAHFDKKVKLKYQIDKQRQTFKCPQNCIKKKNKRTQYCRNCEKGQFFIYM